MGLYPWSTTFSDLCRKGSKEAYTCTGMYGCLSEPLFARRCMHSIVFNAVTCAPLHIFCFHFLKFKMALLTTIDRIQECQAALRPANSTLGWWCWKWHLQSRPSPSTTELAQVCSWTQAKTLQTLDGFVFRFTELFFRLNLSSDKVAWQRSRKPYCLG